MKLLKLWCIMGLLTASVSGFVVGCSSSSNSSSGGSTVVPTVDMAVGDFNTSSVFLFFDVLHPVNPATGTPNDYINPSVTLDDASLSYATDIHFVNGDLYVGDASSYKVVIWRDYLNLADSAAPDAVLALATGGVSKPARIMIVNDILAVPNRNAVNTVTLYNSASTLTGNDTTAPDVTLTTDVDDPTDVVLLGGNTASDTMLFVSNGGATAAGNSVVSVYNDVAAIIAGGVDVAPDVELKEDTSFLSVAEGPHRIVVANNILYVGIGYADWGGVFVFNGANNLSNDQLPDAVLGGIFSPATMLVDNNTLWVGMGNGENSCTSSEVAVQAFPSAGNLINGQSPSVTLGGDLGIWHTQRLATAGGAMFIGGYSNCDFDEGHVNIYFNGASIHTGQQPDISMNGSDNSAYTVGVDPFSSVQGLAAVVRASN